MADLLDAETGEVHVRGVRVVAGIVQRGIGLLGNRTCPPGGVWLSPCNGVHTFGMRFSIDVAVFTETGTLIAVKQGLVRNRIFAPVRGGRSTLELPEGAAARSSLVIGRRYTLGAGTTEPNKES